jgi:acyl-CoA hydrolase
LDRNGRPAEVPPLEIENEEQQKLYDDAKARLEKIKQEKAQN